MRNEAEIILCIPGPWESRTALIQALVRAHGGRCMFAGVMALDTTSGESIMVDLEGHHPGMRAALHSSGLDEATLDEIGRHQHTAYLHFSLYLPTERSRMLAWASVFEKAGGIAIKVESTGLSHGWPRWHEWMGSDFIMDHYRASTILAGGEDGWYSCGMHLFGERDAVTSAGGDEGRELLDTFNRYILLEKPKLASGHTFSTEAGKPKWVMTQIEDDRFDQDSLFHNSNGLWRLERHATHP